LLTKRIKDLEDEIEETNNSYKLEIAKIEEAFKAKIKELEQKNDEMNV
jgi:hypothetical protein